MTPHKHASAAIMVCLAIVAGCRTEAPYCEKLAIDRYVTGQLRMDEGDYDVALASLGAALDADPTLSVAHEAIGDIHRRRGQHQSAQVAYEAACKTNEYAFRPHYNLGVTYQKLAEEARQATQADRCLFYLRKAAEVYIRAATLRPRDFDANVNLSACYFQLGMYDLAEQYCLAAIKVKPESAEAHSNLGVILDSQNRFHDAIRAYRTSLELNAGQTHLRMNLGWTFMRQGNLKSALYEFNQAATLDPTNALAWEQIGVCLYNLQEMAQALQAYEKAVTLNPNSAECYRGMGNVYMAAFLREPNKTDLRDRALEAWGKSLDIKPNQADLRRLVEKAASAKS